MIQLLDDDEGEQGLLAAEGTEEGTEEESLPGTPPDNGFDDLKAIEASPKLMTMWNCENCGKSSPASAKLCPVCKGRLRPPGLA